MTAVRQGARRGVGEEFRARSHPARSQGVHSPFMLYKTSLGITHPWTLQRAVLPTVTNIINQKLGRTCFTIHLIACMHGCREAKSWSSRHWSVWSEDSEQVGFPDPPLLDALLWIVCVQTQISGLWWQFTFIVTVILYLKKKKLPGRHPKKTNVCAAHLQQARPSGHLAGPASFVTYFRRQCGWFGVFKTVNKTGNAFQGRCLTLDKIKYTFKITLHSRRRNIGIFRQGLRESLIFAICIG